MVLRGNKFLIMQEVEILTDKNRFCIVLDTIRKKGNLSLKLKN